MTENETNTEKVFVSTQKLSMKQRALRLFGAAAILSTTVFGGGCADNSKNNAESIKPEAAQAQAVDTSTSILVVEPTTTQTSEPIATRTSMPIVTQTSEPTSTATREPTPTATATKEPIPIPAKQPSPVSTPVFRETGGSPPIIRSFEKEIPADWQWYENKELFFKVAFPENQFQPVNDPQSLNPSFEWILSSVGHFQEFVQKNKKGSFPARIVIANNVNGPADPNGKPDLSTQVYAESIAGRIDGVYRRNLPGNNEDFVKSPNYRKAIVSNQNVRLAGGLQTFEILSRFPAVPGLTSSNTEYVGLVFRTKIQDNFPFRAYIALLISDTSAFNENYITFREIASSLKVINKSY